MTPDEAADLLWHCSSAGLYEMPLRRHRWTLPRSRSVRRRIHDQPAGPTWRGLPPTATGPAHRIPSSPGSSLRRSFGQGCRTQDPRAAHQHTATVPVWGIALNSAWHIIAVSQIRTTGSLGNLDYRPRSRSARPRVRPVPDTASARPCLADHDRRRKRQRAKTSGPLPTPTPPILILYLSSLGGRARHPAWGRRGHCLPCSCWSFSQSRRSLWSTRSDSTPGRPGWDPRTNDIDILGSATAVDSDGCPDWTGVGHRRFSGGAIGERRTEGSRKMRAVRGSTGRRQRIRGEPLTFAQRAHRRPRGGVLRSRSRGSRRSRDLRSRGPMTMRSRLTWLAMVIVAALLGLSLPVVAVVTAVTAPAAAAACVSGSRGRCDLPGVGDLPEECGVDVRRRAGRGVDPAGAGHSPGQRHQGHLLPHRGERAAEPGARAAHRGRGSSDRQPHRHASEHDHAHRRSAGGPDGRRAGSDRGGRGGAALLLPGAGRIVQPDHPGSCPRPGDDLDRVVE